MLYLCMEQTHKKGGSINVYMMSGMENVCENNVGMREACVYGAFTRCLAV